MMRNWGQLYNNYFLPILLVYQIMEDGREEHVACIGEIKENSQDCSR
jgi:hypothetical protein